ncbi:hypothetical protein EDB85DRAFT_1963726, partial [Lactarius pseudohatsudake]
MGPASTSRRGSLCLLLSPFTLFFTLNMALPLSHLCLSSSLSLPVVCYFGLWFWRTGHRPVISYLLSPSRQLRCRQGY